MCDQLTCKDLNLASMVGMVDITCEDLTYDDLTPYVCDNVILGLMI